MPSLNLTFPALGDGETVEVWLRSRLHEVTALLNRPDEEHIFAESPKGLRGYTKRIKHPIDLSLIGEKCSTYCSVDELGWDIALMCQNCVDYNGAATKWAKYANTLLDDTREALAVLRDVYAAIAADNPAPAEALRAAAAANLAAHPMYAKLQSTSLLCAEDTEEPRGASRSPQKSPQKKSPQKRAASPQRSPAASPESTARVDRDGGTQVRLMPVLAAHLRAEAQRSQAEAEALDANPKGRCATASPIASRTHTVDDVLQAFREQFLPAYARAASFAVRLSPASPSTRFLPTTGAGTSTRRSRGRTRCSPPSCRTISRRTRRTSSTPARQAGTGSSRSCCTAANRSGRLCTA